MAAACAVCLGPIAKGERFVLSGTEVFHGRCAMRRGTDRSVRVKLELRVRELERDLSLAHNTVASLRASVDQEKATVVRLRDVADDADRDYRLARTARDTATRDSAYWRDLYERSQRQLEAIRIERAARTVVDAPAAVRPAPAPVQAVSNPDEVAKDDRDATEIRFSLLELDKT